MQSEERYVVLLSNDITTYEEKNIKPKRKKNTEPSAKNPKIKQNEVRHRVVRQNM